MSRIPGEQWRAKRENALRLKNLLGRTFYPFIGRFGRPTPIQIAAAEPILDGRNVLLIAPTASGKTEAALAPVVQRIGCGGGDSVSVVYVVPTRALANNLQQRISPPLEELFFRVAVKHSDAPSLSDPPDVLITTPESLDSLLCRRSQLFQRLQVAIIDEVHVFDTNYRGEQLRVLLKRLAMATEVSQLQGVLISASVHDPQVVAERYVADPTVIKIADSRQSDLCFFDSVDAFAKWVRSKRLRKILCFCNYREKVEQTVQRLRQLLPCHAVYAHHGSLSSSQRLEAERALRESPASICVATSTLEVGIDIGNIEFVFLVEIPWSASSMMQRIGRSNRRSQTISAGALVSNVAEKELVAAMHNAVAQGCLEPVEYEFDPGVVVQQIFSCAFQFRQGVTRNYLATALSPLCGESRLLTYLDYLCESGWIVARADKFYATEKLMNLAERGRIHSNIPDEANMMVLDATTQRPIGRIDATFDEVFALGGRVWKVVRVDNRCVFVRPHYGPAGPASFKPQRKRSGFGKFLPPWFEDVSS